MYNINMTKICLTCQKEKEISDFYSQKKQNGSLIYHPYCKLCHWIKIKENPKYKITRYKAGSVYQKKLRMAVVEKLGGCCVKCGFSDDRALQLDHINGGGKKDRIHRSWQVMYKEIISGKDTSIQLLCANCNWIKRFENREMF